MKVGATYYPELLPPGEWERDLELGRQIGLSALRCGEYAWSAFAPQEGRWQVEWALDFLDLAGKMGYDVIWATPTAAPPPYLFQRWPDLYAVDWKGRIMPTGTGRNYCPSHHAYRDRCTEIAGRLAHDLGAAPAIKGSQVDDKLAGDGFLCYCDRCRTAFQQTLLAKYGTLDTLNSAWQTAFRSEVYTDWRQIPLPFPTSNYKNYAPTLKLDFRRFESSNWLEFYYRQYEAIHGQSSLPITTNFNAMVFNEPFDRWQWMPYLDAISTDLSTGGETTTNFELALSGGASPGDKPLWVMEHRASPQHDPQNRRAYDPEPIKQHLRRCRRAGAEYAIGWRLRQHSSGSQMDREAILRHDGRPTPLSDAITMGIQDVVETTLTRPDESRLLLFSFQQQWARDARSPDGTEWRYLTAVQQQWYSAAAELWGDIRVGRYEDVGVQHRLVLAPHFQLSEPDVLGSEPGLLDSLRIVLEEGGTVVTTVDLLRLDSHNNILRQPPLAALAAWIAVPDLEFLRLRLRFTVEGQVGDSPVVGIWFWAVPVDKATENLTPENQTVEAAPSGSTDEALPPSLTPTSIRETTPGETGMSAPPGQPLSEGIPIGLLRTDDYSGPVALQFSIGRGKLVVVLTVLDRAGVVALLKSLT